ncbi:hypothetical protein MIR68_008811 [Amoeboaphelidium protococcarum]|nr:hypothetical protein MIR68_008811 [Amoeboaphelidium protococcarum]
MAHIILRLIAVLLAILVQNLIAKVTVLSTNDTYDDRIAAFGPNIDIDSPVRGILVAVDQLSPRPTEIIRDNATIIQEQQDVVEQIPQLQFSYIENSPKGCVPVYPPEFILQPAGNETIPPWIALVERGQCSFVDKVRAMQQSGASAVVVGDNEQRNGLIVMFGSGDTSDIDVPSVFVMQWAYRDLRYLGLKNSQTFDARDGVPSDYMLGDEYLWVEISKQQDFQWPMLDIIIVTIIAPIVIFIFLYSLWRFRRRRFITADGQAPGDGDYIGTLSDEDLQRLPVEIYEGSVRSLSIASTSSYQVDDQPDSGAASQDSVYKSEGKRRRNHQQYVKYGKTCAICLDDFVVGDKIRYLVNCSHSFHMQCIDPWLLTKKRVCPICKTDVLVDGSVSSSSSSSINDEYENSDELRITIAEFPQSSSGLPSGSTLHSETSPLVPNAELPYSTQRYIRQGDVGDDQQNLHDFMFESDCNLYDDNQQEQQSLNGNQNSTGYDDEMMDSPALSSTNAVEYTRRSSRPIFQSSAASLRNSRQLDRSAESLILGSVRNGDSQQSSSGSLLGRLFGTPR